MLFPTVKGKAVKLNKASKTELLNNITMLQSQQLTNNIDVIFVTIHISVIQLPC